MYFDCWKIETTNIHKKFMLIAGRLKLRTLGKTKFNFFIPIIEKAAIEKKIIKSWLDFVFSHTSRSFRII